MTHPATDVIFARFRKLSQPGRAATSHARNATHAMPLAPVVTQGLPIQISVFSYFLNHKQDLIPTFCSVHDLMYIFS